MIKFCKTCYNKKHIEYSGVCGYYWCYLDSATVCNECGSTFENIDFPALDLKVLTQVSQDVNFIEAMIKLRNDDIIEYESRMSQFRTQVGKQEQIERQEEDSSKPHCPTCNSTNISKISTTSKAINTVAFGIFGTKRHKTFHCNACKYEW